MSKLERAFITTADKTFKKVKAKNGQIMHFKDGTPISKNAFNAGTQHIKYEGEKVSVAVPSNKGPGYERKEISPKDASALGQSLAIMRNQKDPDINSNMMLARDTYTIDGEEYDLEDLHELNGRIVQKHGGSAVFRYN